MELISDTLISPRADYNIRKRFESYKRRTGSPNFRDILRQRCRERVKARRGALFDHLRLLENEESVRNTLSQFIFKDLEELKSSSALNGKDEFESMDVVENEPLSQLALSDREKWILEEYDKLIEKTEAQVELASAVMCPLCAGGVLSTSQLTGVVTCSLCSLILPHKVPLPDLERLIFHAVDCHSQYCEEQPNFTTCPDNLTSNLLLLCSLCGHFQLII